MITCFKDDQSFIDAAFIDVVHDIIVIKLY